MIELSLAEIADIVGGTLADVPNADAVITGEVEFDSRKIGPGDLFVALGGARVDGHDFAAQAIKQGAVAVLAFRKVGVPAILVPPVPENERRRDSYALENDTDGSVAAVLAGLGALARGVIDRLSMSHEPGGRALTVVGVTGSAGKTSTKDFMATIFRAAGSTVAPPGSFNNEIGHPYTALKCTANTEYLVAEMSARGLGHVANLARIAPPRIGVELNVGSAHLGEFGSREVIAQAKGELVEALPAADAGGVAVLNADDDYVVGMASRTSAKVLWYSAAGKRAVSLGDGHESPVDLVASKVTLDAVARPSFELTLRGKYVGQVQLEVVGEHQVANALAAIGAGLGAGLDIDLILEAVRAHRAASAHRMAVSTTAAGLTIIDDAYNANPESMHAGLSACARMARSQGGKAIAVLGPMGELGDESPKAHHSLGQTLAPLGIDRLVVVGDNPSSRALAKAAVEAGVDTEVVADNAAATRLLKPMAGANDVLLVKASNAFRLWEIAQALDEAE